MPPKSTFAEGPGRCPRCSDRVYQAEQVVGAGGKWHKKCFACKECGKKLDSTTCNSHEGKWRYASVLTKFKKSFEFPMLIHGLITLHFSRDE